jgi:hypothetical protein
MGIISVESAVIGNEYRRMPAQHPPPRRAHHRFVLVSPPTYIFPEPPPSPAQHLRCPPPHPPRPPPTPKRTQSCPIPRQPPGRQLASAGRQASPTWPQTNRGRRRPPPAGKPAASDVLAVAMRGRTAVFHSPPLLRASSTPPHNHGRPSRRHADPSCAFPGFDYSGVLLPLEDAQGPEQRARKRTSRFWRNNACVSQTHHIIFSAEKQRRVMQIALVVKNWYIQNWPEGCSEVQ